MPKYCYLNGKILNEKKACISPHDLGMLRGYGIFDFMCTASNNKPFLLTDHWNRLNRSAKYLGLSIPIKKTEYTQIINKLLQKNNYKNSAIRTVLTAGISINGITLPDNPTFYILIHDINLMLPNKQLYDTGAKIITHDFARDNFESKTTNYIEAIKYQKEKNRRNAIELLYTNDNNVLECTTSNIFIIKNNTLMTPSDGILPGITRKLVLKIAEKNNIKLQKRVLTTKQLLNADEVFLTGSAKHILPITKVDSQKIGNGKVGKLTKRISDLYLDYFNKY